MKIYLIYDKTSSTFIDKRPLSEGRRYLVYGDIRSARMMANQIKKYGIRLDNKHKNDDVIVVEYEANIEHMREI